MIRLKSRPPTISTRKSAWPTAAELDLLKAALLSDARATAAWDRWRARSGGLAGPEELRLLPLADWNLRRVAGRTSGFSASDDHEPDLLQREWVARQQLLDHVKTVLERLERRGVRPLLFKGIALSELFYPLPSLRPAGDVDLLVGSRNLAAARAAVEELGYEVENAEPDSRVAHLHAVAYRLPGGPSIDLHAHALLECPEAGADDSLFSRAVEMEIAGLRAATMSPADHLLCVCVHGLRWSGSPAIHWVADAVTIVRRAGASLSWDTLVDETRRRGVSAWLARTLRLIRTELDAPVPDQVLDAVSAAVRRGERRELASWTKPPTLARGLFLHWRRLAREHPEFSTPRRLARFPRHLRELWGLEGTWQVPLAAARKSAARLGIARG